MIARLTVVGLALALPVFVGLWALALQSPANTGVGMVVEQPLAFSHLIHAGRLGLDCRYCHTSAETSSFAGIPSTQQCMTCHSQIVQALPDIGALAASLNSGNPIAWQRVYNLPDYVYFDHSAHVMGGVACETCHGIVEQMSVVYKATPLTMDWCVECHRNPTPFIHSPDTAAIGSQRNVNAQNAAAQPVFTMSQMQRLTDCDVCHR